MATPDLELLICAARNGREAEVSDLIMKGAKPYSVDSNGNTPLIAAAEAAMRG